MSIGQAFLLKILLDQATSLLMVLDPKDFQEEFEKPIYDFIVEYYRSHKALPPVELVRRKFKMDDPLDGALAFWYDEFLKRKIILRYDSYLNQINQSMSAGKMEIAKAQLQDMSIEISRIGVEESPIRTRQELLQTVVNNIPARRLVAGITGIRTPWPSLTRMFRGFIPGNVYVFAGRKKKGKTQILILCNEIAYYDGNDSLFVSMEITEEEHADRMLSLEANIGLNFITTGRISTPMEGILGRARANPATYNFREGFYNASTSQIEHLIIMLKPKIVFIDGAYLVRPMIQYGKMSGWERVAQTVMELKMIAGKHHIPLVLTYQFNKEGEIHLSDAIAQIATTVIGVYEPNDRPNVRLLRIKDNRMGVCGDVLISFDFNNVNFTELEASDEGALGQFMEEGDDGGE